jgi:hypothetical protein
MQVWRFMCNLLKNVYYRENIAISVINEDKMSGCFWKFEDVLDWNPNKQGFNLVKSDESIAFRSLITVLRVFLPDKDPI